jgi:predicted amidohydrolase YtcJ
MLIDAHVHIALNNVFNAKEWKASGKKEKKEWIRRIFREYRKLGIGALRDGGDALFVSAFARELAEEEGIDYRSPIFAVYKKGHYGSFLGRPVGDMDDFRREFKVLLNNKADHLKIILTGIVNFEKYGDVGETAFTREQLKIMVETAKDHNMPVMVHANGREGVSAAIKAGVDSIEHGYLISEEEVHGIAEAGIIWVPTLSPLANILESNAAGFEKQKGIIQRVYSGQALNLKKAAELGAIIALGSDAGAYMVPHGKGILDEIRHFEKAGFNREEITGMIKKIPKTLFTGKV